MKKPLTDRQSCATCRHFVANRSDNAGHCRRFPPVPSIQDGAIITLWPGISVADWCGEFSRKLHS